MPQRKQETRRFLATVLFTDIVGSTSRAAELGDRGWRDLLERHHAVVRRELKAFGGREMDTAGDGFFAVFETPERAVRCAESIISGVGPLGLEVRAGVHTGECQVVDGKVGGMTVTIGARIAALANAGQVLVSRSVRDLMTGSSRHFTGGEHQTLKGVDGPWRVYRLVPEEMNGEKLGSSRRPSMVPLYTRRQRRRLVAGLAGFLVLAVAVAAGYVLTRPDPVVVVGEDAVGVIGPGGQPRVSAAVKVGQQPTAVAVGFGSVWVTNAADDSVSRIDPHTRVSVPVSVGASPSGVAVGAGSVWVANSGDATVSRIDPATSRSTSIPVRPGPTGIVVAFGSVWVTNELDVSVTQIDPDTDKTRKVVRVGSGPTGIAAGGGYLWVTNQEDGTVTRFDPKTHEADSAVKVGSGPVGIAFGDGAAWVANTLDGSLSRIDEHDLSVTSRTLTTGGGAYGVAVHGGDVWVSNEHAGNLMRVTARTFLLGATVPLGGAPMGLAFVGNDLWFTSAGGSASHRGGVLTMVGYSVNSDDDDPPVLDPLVHYSQLYSRLAALTNDGLVGFRRAGGVQGAGIVPDLATALPAPTDGGLTYTFHLRQGVLYSTGARVLAGDIRRGIERTVVHPDTAPFTYYASSIVGALDCQEAAKKALARRRPRPDCDLRTGITTDDRTGAVTFHLTKPTPEFLYQLALPNASAVPQDTPVDLKPGTFVPATGPYKIASYAPKHAGWGGRLVLVRNPHFHVWSPEAQPAGYPNSIVLGTGYYDEDAVGQVSRGQADIVWWPSAGELARLGTRYRSQMHTDPSIFVDSVVLNTRKPPFDNRDARRAVAYAMDRRALTGPTTFSGTVTCQLIPPDFATYHPYCPFTLGGGADGKWTGPDLAKAQQLVRRSGTHGAKVVVAAENFPTYKAAGAVMVSTLKRLGYVATLQVRNSHDYTTLFAGKSWDVGHISWGADYPAASSYLGPLASCDPDLGFENYSRYCDPKLDKQIAAALAQQATDAGAANDAWAAIDRTMVDAAATIPFGAEVDQNFVSRRVGNVVINPILGPLLDQMWVH